MTVKVVILKEDTPLLVTMPISRWSNLEFTQSRKNSSIDDLFYLWNLVLHLAQTKMGTGRSKKPTKADLKTVLLEHLKTTGMIHVDADPKHRDGKTARIEHNAAFGYNKAIEATWSFLGLMTNKFDLTSTVTGIDDLVALQGYDHQAIKSYMDKQAQEPPDDEAAEASTQPAARWTIGAFMPYPVKVFCARQGVVGQHSVWADTLDIIKYGWARWIITDGKPLTLREWQLQTKAGIRKLIPDETAKQDEMWTMSKARLEKRRLSAADVEALYEEENTGGRGEILHHTMLVQAWGEEEDRLQVSLREHYKQFPETRSAKSWARYEEEKKVAKEKEDRLNEVAKEKEEDRLNEAAKKKGEDRLAKAATQETEEHTADAKWCTSAKHLFEMIANLKWCAKATRAPLGGASGYRTVCGVCTGYMEAVDKTTMVLCILCHRRVHHGCASIYANFPLCLECDLEREQAKTPSQTKTQEEIDSARKFVGAVADASAIADVYKAQEGKKGSLSEQDIRDHKAMVAFRKSFTSVAAKMFAGLRRRKDLDPTQVNDDNDDDLDDSSSDTVDIVGDNTPLVRKSGRKRKQTDQFNPGSDIYNNTPYSRHQNKRKKKRVQESEEEEEEVEEAKEKEVEEEENEDRGKKKQKKISKPTGTQNKPTPTIPLDLTTRKPLPLRFLATTATTLWSLAFREAGIAAVIPTRVVATFWPISDKRDNAEQLQSDLYASAYKVLNNFDVKLTEFHKDVKTEAWEDQTVRIVITNAKGAAILSQVMIEKYKISMAKQMPAVVLSLAYDTNLLSTVIHYGGTKTVYPREDVYLWTYVPHVDGVAAFIDHFHTSHRDMDPFMGDVVHVPARSFVGIRVRGNKMGKYYIDVPGDGFRMDAYLGHFIVTRLCTITDCVWDLTPSMNQSCFPSLDLDTDARARDYQNADVNSRMEHEAGQFKPYSVGHAGWLGVALLSSPIRDGVYMATEPPTFRGDASDGPQRRFEDVLLMGRILETVRSSLMPMAGFVLEDEVDDDLRPRSRFGYTFSRTLSEMTFSAYEDMDQHRFERGGATTEHDFMTAVGTMDDLKECLKYHHAWKMEPGLAKNKGKSLKLYIEHPEVFSNEALTKPKLGGLWVRKGAQIKKGDAIVSFAGRWVPKSTWAYYKQKERMHLEGERDTTYTTGHHVIDLRDHTNNTYWPLMWTRNLEYVTYPTQAVAIRYQDHDSNCEYTLNEMDKSSDELVRVNANDADENNKELIMGSRIHRNETFLPLYTVIASQDIDARKEKIELVISDKRMALHEN